MSAHIAFKVADALGIDLNADHDGLEINAECPPPDEIMAFFARHKEEILQDLKLRGWVWSEEDWRFFFEERAAIHEHEAGKTPYAAETAAYDDCKHEWRRQNPNPFPDRCVQCGGRALPGRPLATFDCDGQDARLHRDCHQAWDTCRDREAVAALLEVKISEPTPF